MTDSITGLVIARNEERDLPGCLQAWGDICERVVLVDDDSNDNTRAIAASFGCDVVPSAMQPDTGFAGLRNTGLDKIDTALTLVFDADERPTTALLRSIARVNSTEQAYQIARRNYAFGGPLNHGRFASDYQTRLFPSDIRYQGIVHETPQLPDSMPVETLEGHMDHFTYTSLGEYFAKMRQYAKQMAEVHNDPPSLRHTLRQHAEQLRSHPTNGDGWRGAVMNIGDAAHDLAVIAHMHSSLSGEAYIHSSEQRAFDVTAAIGIGTVGVPFLGMAALALGVEQRRPDMFFRQGRVGKNGKPFPLFKLRTITGQDFSGNLELGGSHHPRATRLGKTVRQVGIDELPQIANVLAGDLHIAGIRPQVPLTLDQRREADPVLFDEWWQWAQLKPGILGPGQQIAHEAGSYMENSALVRKVMRVDVQFCETASLQNDIRCLLATPIDKLRGTAQKLRRRSS